MHHRPCVGSNHTRRAEGNNTFQPHRTLDVIREDGDPQFRITRERNASVNAGIHADFQVSTAGNLHIRPRAGSNTRAVAIGFLAGEQNDPINAINARLDVGGITRIRNVPTMQNPNCIVVGTNVLNANDNVLGRINFPTGPNADCLVINGDGQWVDICCCMRPAPQRPPVAGCHGLTLASQQNNFEKAWWIEN